MGAEEMIVRSNHCYLYWNFDCCWTFDKVEFIFEQFGKYNALQFRRLAHSTIMIIQSCGCLVAGYFQYFLWQILVRQKKQQKLQLLIESKRKSWLTLTLYCYWNLNRNLKCTFEKNVKTFFLSKTPTEYLLSRI